MTEQDTAVRLMSQLSGCKDHWTWRLKEQAVKAIQHLATCEEHHGNHHFFVIDEGYSVSMSETGTECLMKANLIS